MEVWDEMRMAATPGRSSRLHDASLSHETLPSQRHRFWLMHAPATAVPAVTAVAAAIADSNSGNDTSDSSCDDSSNDNTGPVVLAPLDGFEGCLAALTLLTPHPSSHCRALPVLITVPLWGANRRDGSVARVCGGGMGGYVCIFRKPVLGCIEVDFSNQRLLLQHLLRSTSFTHFCAAPNANI